MGTNAVFIIIWTKSTTNYCPWYKQFWRKPEKLSSPECIELMEFGTQGTGHLFRYTLGIVTTRIRYFGTQLYFENKITMADSLSVGYI